MTKPDEKNQNLTLVDINPSLLLQGEVPRLIDEWQVAPKLWDAIRYEVDHRNEEGQFILNGSAVPAKMNEPSFLLVLTAVGTYAYRREDGVYVVPIGCLKS